MVVGGIDQNRRYLDDVELYAPGLPCHQGKLSPYPMKIAGPTGNMARSGKVVICGGAEAKYVDKRKPNQHNIPGINFHRESFQSTSYFLKPGKTEVRHEPEDSGVEINVVNLSWYLPV